MTAVTWHPPTWGRDGVSKLVAIPLLPGAGRTWPHGVTTVAVWYSSENAWCNRTTGRPLDPQPYAVAEMPDAPDPEVFR